MAPADCPCEFHGTLYPTGSVVKEDCNAWSVPSAGGGRRWKIPGLSIRAAHRGPESPDDMGMLSQHLRVTDVIGSNLWEESPPPILEMGRLRSGGGRSVGPAPSSISSRPGRVAEPLPLWSLCFSTCTAGKWVCSTSVCPGTPDPHLGLDPLPLVSQLLGQGNSGSQACCWARVGSGRETPSEFLAQPPCLCFSRAALPD